MSNASALPLARPRPFRFNWLVPVLFRPRAVFAQMAAEARPVWLTPLLVLTLSGLLAVAVAGPLKIAAAQSGQVELPTDFQYWPVEQQASYMESQKLASGPVFVYVFPALLAVLQVWVGWLVAGGLLHLVLTLFGGRGSTDASLNIAAWAAVPFVLRDLVRAGYILAEHKLIGAAGLAGFAPTAEGLGNLLLAAVLALIDLYALWYLLLMFIGVRAAGGMSRGRALAAVLITALLVLVLAVVPGAALRQFGGGLGGLNTYRPFF